ncbi:hydroxymethylbilane synthase [Natronoarchaeum philippinense]|uniref:Hydroxymethylbilane synthase n=1 Tax=Natronoarchaeum philippinense TaxID=558529 RepID=A0A285P7I7_NATPI|nr:hydroxymethylbilane synthase [Natronoarchaeum philippinense]SNZ17705.1 hydroxymethylbilane synthase [Natronoarchaeum philippinense]
MSTRGTIRLATRGSDLALRQATTVKEVLEDRRYDVELVEVETTGDQIQDELIHRLGKTGAFVRSLDEKVIEGDVDAAVHSMKDMPTDQPDDLLVAGIPERATPGDALVTPDGSTLDELPEGATVGTSSLRRQAQLLDARPDLTVEPLRGNVDTRIEKLLAPGLQAEHEARTEAEKEKKGSTDDDYEHPYEQDVETWFSELDEIERRALEREPDTEYDAIVLAEAGLDRSGLAHRVEYRQLPTSGFVPAPGQGALAVTSRDDEIGEALTTLLDHPRTRVETTVERAVLAELGGGCVAPIGVHAVLRGEYVHADVQVYSRDGTESVTASRDLPADRHVAAARSLARELAEQGADDLIAQARRDDEEPEAKREESA